MAQVSKKIPVNKGARETDSDRRSGNPCFSYSSYFSSRATKSPFFLCHFWWQKWRKSHAPHLWRRRESQSLKRMLRRQSVCRLRFFTPLQLSPAATAKSVAYPPTMRSAGFRCACGASIKKDTREQGGASLWWRKGIRKMRERRVADCGENSVPNKKASPQFARRK